MSLFLPCLMVREFRGCSKLMTTIRAIHYDSGYGYLVLLTLRWFIKVDFSKGRRSKHTSAPLFVIRGYLRSRRLPGEQLFSGYFV